jgi:hypothetical protein
MKKFIFLILFSISFQLFAYTRDYICSVRYYQLSFNLGDSTTLLWVYDRSARQNIYSNYVSWQETSGNFLTYHFPSLNNQEAKLTFHKDVRENLPDRFSGWIDGSFGGFLIYDSFTCMVQD